MGSLSHDISHGVGIARIELRRSLRKSFGTRKRQLAALGFIMLFAPTLFFWGRIAYDAGRAAVRQGQLPVDILGVQLSLLVVVFVMMGALRIIQQGRPEGESLLLTITSPRAVLIGQTIHATIQLVGFVLIPTVLFAGAFAIGAGQLSIVITAILAVVLLFTAVSVLGTVVGQLVMLCLLRSRTLRAASRGFGLLLVLVLMALSYASVAPVVGETELLAPLTTLTIPATLYLSFVFVSSSLSPGVGVGSVVVMGFIITSIPMLFSLSTRLAQRLWFADATPTDLMQRDESASTATPDTTAGATHNQVFPTRGGPRTLTVALGLWTRWLRIPVRFSTLFPVVIVLVMALVSAVNTPNQLPLVVGGVLVFAGAYVSGGIFGLNPLGEAGEMRTIEFLSPTSPQTLVLGHILAGLLVGVPIAVFGTVMLAIAVGLSVPLTLALVALTAMLTLASSGIAVGIGSILPSQDARRTYRGYEVATPSQWALISYMFGVMLLIVIAAVGTVLVLFSSDPAIQSSLAAVAAGIATIVLLTVAYAGTRVGIKRFGESPYRRTGGVSDEPSVTHD